MFHHPASHLQYIKDGSIFLTLMPVTEIPERLDLRWFGDELPGDAALIRELPGRVHGNICYRAHSIVLHVLNNAAAAAHPKGGSAARDSRKAFLTYRTGLGTQKFEIHCYALMAQLDTLLLLPDDVLHAVLLGVVQAQMTGAGRGFQDAQREYSKAFMEGRLKKSKSRGSDRVAVSIEPPAPAAAPALATAV